MISHLGGNIEAHFDSAMRWGSTECCTGNHFLILFLRVSIREGWSPETASNSARFSLLRSAGKLVPDLIHFDVTLQIANITSSGNIQGKKKIKHGSHRYGELSPSPTPPNERITALDIFKKNPLICCAFIAFLSRLNIFENCGLYSPQFAAYR